MEQDSTTGNADGTGLFTGEAWFDPIEEGILERVRDFIGKLLEQGLMAAPSIGSADRCFADGSQKRWPQTVRAGNRVAQGATGTGRESGSS